MTDVDWYPYVTDAPPCDAAQLDAFEAAVGAVLPEEYRAFMTEHAGMVSDPEVIDLDKGDTVFGPIYFLDKAVPKKTEPLNAWVALKRFREWLGDDNAAIAPLASNLSKGLFFIDLRVQGKADVKFADTYLEPSDKHAFFEIADTIPQLLTKLHG